MFLTDEQIEQNKKEFIRMLNSTDKDEPSISKIVKWLESTDFFSAPSSSRFHGNYKGGLCRHSLNVTKMALDIAENLDLLYMNRKGETKLTDLPIEEQKNEHGRQKITYSEIVICGLLHDLCKVNMYKPTTKYYKDENNQWKTYEGYEKDYSFPYGHGEYSVEIIRSFINLTKNEMLGIRWHMGPYDGGNLLNGESKYAYDKAVEMFPIVSILISADFLASHNMEYIFDLKTLK